MCMSFIAYATGAQLVMKNFRGLGKRILVSALCVSSSVLVVVGLLTYVSLKKRRGGSQGACRTSKDRNHVTA
jgi:predicted RecA/RadA family phage recombinase